MQGAPSALNGHALLMRLILCALAAAIATVVFSAASDREHHPALAAYPDAICSGDLRHLSWVWHFPVDGSKQAIADTLVSHNMGVILKTHDGTDWMSTYDHSPDAVSGPAQVRKLADYFESRGVPLFTYAVVKGEDPIREAQMAAQVLASGSRGIFLDIEPWQGYWRGTPAAAVTFGQELRRLAPNGIVIATVEPRPWVVPNIPMAEFAAFSDAIAPMVYWESFKSNGPYFAAAGYPPPPEGVTPEFILDVGNALFDRYNLPIMPIGQGASLDMSLWNRFLNHSAQLGMPVVSTWRHGVTHPPVFDLLRDRSPGGWPALCDGASAEPFLRGDFNGDQREDLVHLTRRDFLRPWLSRADGSFDVGFLRPWPGYAIQSGTWQTGNFNGDNRDDLIHLTAGDYANVWLAKRDGSLGVSTFRPWPGYAMQSGSWQTGDFNGDGRDDLVHLTGGDYANVWPARPDGTFSVSTFLPWPGYAIQYGTWRSGDFNGDDRDDLVHLTAADYANVWLAQPDGTFSVSAHSPWPGYAMQYGTWQSGDFNGDGRDDLVHLTAADYANVWLGQAGGSFSVSTHSPWPGYVIQSGGWQTGDFNGDGRDDLVHLAAGDYAHSWTSQGNGSFTVGILRAWPGYNFQSGTWLSGDFSGDGRDDLIHFAGGDYAHPWISQPDGSFSVGFFRPWPGYRM